MGGKGSHTRDRADSDVNFPDGSLDTFDSDDGDGGPSTPPQHCFCHQTLPCCSWSKKHEGDILSQKEKGKKKMPSFMELNKRRAKKASFYSTVPY